MPENEQQSEAESSEPTTQPEPFAGWAPPLLGGAYERDPDTGEIVRKE